MYPSTLYELLGVPETVAPQMVESAALVESGGVTTAAGRAAVAVLSDRAARADYDARAEQGLSFEMALAWGVAAYASGDPSTARYHWQRAARIAPDNRAVPLLLESVADAPDTPRPEVPAPAREAARAEIERVRNNSAFPHRLIRYAAALAAEPDDAPGEEAAMMANAARELLQYDIAEAPRAYSMVLPVLRDHYQAVYALDAPFFDATMALLESHTPRAEYERGKGMRPHRRTARPNPDDNPEHFGESAGADSVPEDLPPMDLPPLRIPGHRVEMPRLSLPTITLPNPGPAWVGAVIGVLLTLEEGPLGMVGGAVIGFAIAYALVLLFRRR